MSELLDKLLKHGFITGSQAFGTAREDSDIDIVYSIQDSGYISAIIGDRERTPSDYFAGYLIEDDSGKSINLIPVHPHEFFPWFLATKAMAATLAESEIVDPIKKYSVFMGIVCLFKATVAELQNLAAYDILRDRILGKKSEFFSGDLEDLPIQKKPAQEAGF